MPKAPHFLRYQKAVDEKSKAFIRPQPVKEADGERQYPEAGARHRTGYLRNARARNSSVSLHFCFFDNIPWKKGTGGVVKHGGENPI